VSQLLPVSFEETSSMLLDIDEVFLGARFTIGTFASKPIDLE
jgi:hypothetical protein